VNVCECQSSFAIEAHSERRARWCWTAKRTGGQRCFLNLGHSLYSYTTEDRTWVLTDGDGQGNFVSHELERVTVCALPLNRNLLGSLRPAAVGSRVTRNSGGGPSGVFPIGSLLRSRNWIPFHNSRRQRSCGSFLKRRSPSCSSSRGRMSSPSLSPFGRKPAT
jgi:hypothetical protein